MRIWNLHQVYLVDLPRMACFYSVRCSRVLLHLEVYIDMPCYPREKSLSCGVSDEHFCFHITPHFAWTWHRYQQVVEILLALITAMLRII